MENGDDAYKILAVPPTATDAEIKKAYRKLALKHHPDKQTNDAARAEAQDIFSKLAAAYEILSDETERAKYDREQREAAEANNASGVGSKKKGKGSTGTGGFNQKKHKNFNFHDPYDVYKFAFEQEFGIAYPGEKYDNVAPEKLEQAKRLPGYNQPKLLTSGKEKNKNKGSSGGSVASSHHSQAEPHSPKKGWNPFRRSQKSPVKETQLVVRGEQGGGKENHRGGNDRNSRALVPHNPQGRAIQEYNAGTGGNNRPVSMETREIKIEHKDGRVETIQETVIKRPDGSTETMRVTDMPDSNTDNWNRSPTKKSKDKMKRLTNGPEAPKLLTNGGNSSSASASASASGTKRLTNGSKASTKSSKHSSSTTVKAIKDDPAKSNKSRSMVPWGGGKKK